MWYKRNLYFIVNYDFVASQVARNCCNSEKEKPSNFFIIFTVAPLYLCFAILRKDVINKCRKTHVLRNRRNYIIIIWLNSKMSRNSVKKEKFSDINFWFFLKRFTSFSQKCDFFPQIFSTFIIILFLYNK